MLHPGVTCGIRPLQRPSIYKNTFQAQKYRRCGQPRATGILVEDKVYNLESLLSREHKMVITAQPDSRY